MEHRGQSLSFRNGGMALKRMLLTRDFWSGMLFAAFGIAALAFGHDLADRFCGTHGAGTCAHARDGNLPFACRLMVLLSMMGHWLNSFCRRRNPISGRSSNGGFWSMKVENALSFNGS
jgi:hypothetical protein